MEVVVADMESKSCPKTNHNQSGNQNYCSRHSFTIKHSVIKIIPWTENVKDAEKFTCSPN